MGKFLITLICLLNASAAVASLSTDMAYDQVAFKLELVRNQMELTIENHDSLESDVNRQNHELVGMDVFLRIPLESRDAKTDKDLLEGIRADLANASGYRVRKLSFSGGWKRAPRKVPKTVPFDIGFRATDDQLVDRRELVLDVEFDGKAPKDAQAWFRGQAGNVRRLLSPIRAKAWTASGKRLTARAEIFRFREFEYPRFLAPDLSRYTVPSAPESQSQTSATKRIERYRREIVDLWPRVQPHLDDVRQFALNDLRMSFYLSRANLAEHGHTH